MHGARTGSQPRFALTERNATAVTLICCRLDGIPLAIELAVARLSALPVEGLSARLEDRFRLLSAGNRAAPAGQQTLRAAIDWSHELLDGPERTLLRRLSIFVGGCALAAARYRGCYPRAALGAEALELFRMLANSHGVMCALLNLGDLARLEGDTGGPCPTTGRARPWPSSRSPGSSWQGTWKGWRRCT